MALNVFLTPSVRPVFAMTYAPAVERDSMYSFLSVCEQVKGYYDRNGHSVEEFFPRENSSPVSDETSLVQALRNITIQRTADSGMVRSFHLTPLCCICFTSFQLITALP